MDTHVQRVFYMELERQCRFALTAAGDLETALRRPDTDRIWYSVQGFLVAAGNLSKVLWPPNKTYDQRGTELRQSLGVKGDSPLAPRTFRNHFEHFDERLEVWATSSKRKNFIDSNIGPPDFLAGFEAEDFLRNLDTQNMAVTFRGDVYSLKPVIAAIRDLRERAASALAESLGVPRRR